jgi:hypothetical protein
MGLTLGIATRSDRRRVSRSTVDRSGSENLLVFKDEERLKISADLAPVQAGPREEARPAEGRGLAARAGAPNVHPGAAVVNGGERPPGPRGRNRGIFRELRQHFLLSVAWVCLKSQKPVGHELSFVAHFSRCEDQNHDG